MGRIYAFLENTGEATKEFDEAIRIGDVPGGAFKDAVEGKKKLTQPYTKEVRLTRVIERERQCDNSQIADVAPR